ncbi:carbamoyltransferase HypF [Endomicrobium proavitum]|uniref:Carbamoyltransferase n=1 Tax=Endomicrobium proavitum TaxID=1408281 RepID=A0A0G3WJL0_9BACT|nr:carbamoyltransferase HypF [Endomicrobium proavitum]AKL97684.1 (NiFe) hydrogenase maturation protein HypF [Endomicrobium proavitum]
MKKHCAVLIKAVGVVQGVGFRPFVFNLAGKLHLYGFVRNTGFGAEIIVEGKKDDVVKFLSDLKKSKFKAEYTAQETAAKRYENFRIKESKKTPILSEFPSDLAMCNECKKELFSKNDRRHNYSFINCVNCGPRFSIIKKLPYDRKNTSMAKFKMCPACLAEYNNPKNRRFHAQPNACSVCGPQISLFDKNTKLISVKEKALKDAIKFLKSGKIVAVKGIGGYHLMCDASNINAVKLLRKRKNRPYKPFAVMADIKTAKKLCRVNKYEENELTSSKAPIVILEKKRKDKKLSALSANATLGVMLAYAPIHHLIIKEIPFLAATSGNRSDEPLSAREDEAFKNLSQIADYFLTHNREIENRSDDSIVRFLPNSGEKIIIRRSRGFVPEPLDINIADSVIAAGGDLKNNFCITRNAKTYMSQFVGDLANKSNMDFYAESIKKMASFLDVNPKTQMCDAHNGYASSQYFKNKFQKPKIVFHHYAHIASVIAEHNLKGNILGFAFDGNGLGEDGKIWGGEIVIFDGKNFSRAAHLDYFNLPGGDLCAQEIWRNAASLLHKYNFDSYIPKFFGKLNWRAAVKMIDSNINSFATSSMGRVFDAVSAILNIKTFAAFEAEGAIALEDAAWRALRKNNIAAEYDFEVKNDVIDLKKTFTGILSDLDNKIQKDIISLKFHNTIISVITACCKKFNAKTVALSGGVFQNMLLLSKTVEKLRKKKIKVYFNQKVPANDGGIALGQAYISKLASKNDKI